MTCPIPPTAIPSVAEGETFASGVQVPPCAYAACAAVKVPSAPATIARNHFLRVQKLSNIFLSSLEVLACQKNAIATCSRKAIRRNANAYTEAGTLACIPAGWASFAFAWRVKDLRLRSERGLRSTPAKFGFRKPGELRAQAHVTCRRSRRCSLPSPDNGGVPNRVPPVGALSGSRLWARPALRWGCCSGQGGNHPANETQPSQRRQALGAPRLPMGFSGLLFPRKWRISESGHQLAGTFSQTALP